MPRGRPPKYTTDAERKAANYAKLKRYRQKTRDGELEGSVKPTPMPEEMGVSTEGVEDLSGWHT